MTESVLQFARDFEKLKSDLASTEAPDSKLLLLVDYWPNLSKFAQKPAFQPYFDEYISILKQLIVEENLYDLTVDELQNLFNTLQAVNDLFPENKEFLRISGISLAKKYFYVGAYESALDVCGKILDGKIKINLDFNPENLSEFELFSQVCDSAKEDSQQLYELLFGVLLEWQAVHESVGQAGVNCLFVEKNDHGTAFRGRMKTLEGTISLHDKSAVTDEITFESMIIKPEDAFVGAAYDALKAVRTVFGRFRTDDRGKRYFHAHYSIKNSPQTFTGDSIGLGAAMLSYVQLLRTDISRQDRFVASDVAFTGSVDEQGNIGPANNETLGNKIERAFFSPVKHIVVPEANLDMARSHLDKLHHKCPRRNLQIIPAGHLKEIIANHNVIRSEKVCPGVIIKKTIYKYSRMAKVQVPLLLVLIYILVCQIYPKAWIWFDWNPEYVAINGEGFYVYNMDSLFLWSKFYNCNFLDGRSLWLVEDLNGDEKNEVAFLPRSKAECTDNADLFVYESNGDFLFRRQCIVLNELKLDTNIQELYKPIGLEIIEWNSRDIMVTKVAKEFFARTHFIFWDSNGDMLGWFIGHGFSSNKSVKCFADTENECILFMGTNNRMKRAAIFSLIPDSCFGVGPPYIDPDYELEYVNKGNQQLYVVFPATDLNRALGQPYNGVYGIYPESKEVVRIDIVEGDKRDLILSYYFDSNFRVFGLKADDEFFVVRDNLVSEGKLPAINRTKYLARMLNDVAYWTDSGWITEGEIRALSQ